MTISVTGHRNVVIDDALKQAIIVFFNEMLTKHEQVTLLSPLAQGADQLVAEIFTKHEYGILHVTLPCSQDMYLQSFNTSDKKHFLKLIDKATHIFEVPKVHKHIYANLGRYMVDNSDVLLALWDGTVNHKKGGTADVVHYADAKGHTVVHILSSRK